MEERDDSMGLSFLMNSKKKPSSDELSLSSGQSSLEDKRSDTSSIKSFSIKPNVIDVSSHLSKEPYQQSPQQFFDEEEYTEEGEQDNDDGEDMESIEYQGDNRGDNRGNNRNFNSTRVSDEEIINMKKELLYQFERLEKKGLKLPKKFTLGSNLEEMKMEYDRLKRDREVDNSIKFQRRMAMSAVSMIEWTTGKFNFIGARLDGWSEKMYEDIDDYDDVFEELHEKYKEKGKIAPELRLIGGIAGSAFMFHMTNRYSSTLPGLDQVLKNNPELARKLAEATTQTQNSQQQASTSFFGNLFGNMFGGGGGEQQQPASPPPEYHAQQVPQQANRNVKMKGPTTQNIEDILADLERNNNNERIEVMSVLSESDMSYSDDVESSINGLILGDSKKKKKGLTLNI